MTRVRCIAIRSFFAIALVSAFVFPATSALSTRELRIENFQSETVVMPDGTIDVTETIQAHFIGGPWHGVFRKIPVGYVFPPWPDYYLFFHVKGLVKRSGQRPKC